ncbi:hypothetical protein PsorP6_004867 [Peronosclerospora sorghi]|uniref:Uncharacterized protein n=1 Tax=Peronosclerospora sorghi TaxID=230839 RepID=A0ACC0W2B1_9STRA|nr:hypothetical protein PsorP6_004867 [Peronosclerospora sorghi]
MLASVSPDCTRYRKGEGDGGGGARSWRELQVMELVLTVPVTPKRWLISNHDVNSGTSEQQEEENVSKVEDNTEELTDEAFNLTDLCNINQISLMALYGSETEMFIMLLSATPVTNNVNDVTVVILLQRVQFRALYSAALRTQLTRNVLHQNIYDVTFFIALKLNC